MGRSQDLLGKIIRLEEREADAVKNLSEQMETNRALRKNVIGLTKKLEERDLSLNTVNQVHTEMYMYTNTVVALKCSL